MTTYDALQAVQASVKERFDDQPLEELRSFLVLANGPQAELPEEQDRRTVVVAVAHVYRKRFGPTLEHLPCETLAAMCAAHTDAEGYYVSRVAAAESDAIQYDLIEARHRVEMFYADGLPSTLVATVAPCENHWAVKP